MLTNIDAIKGPGQNKTKGRLFLSPYHDDTQQHGNDDHDDAPNRTGKGTTIPTNPDKQCCGIGNCSDGDPTQIDQKSMVDPDAVKQRH